MRWIRNLRNLAAALIVSMAVPAMAAPFTLGETTFPRGVDAFPDQVTCLNADEPCGAPILFSELPFLSFISPASTLEADHVLDGAYTDLTDEDNLRLDYPVPIANQPGPDLYLAQARYIASDLALFAPSINDFGIKFDNAPNTWHTIAADQFVEDAVLPAQSIVFTDGGALEGAAFEVWFNLVELSDFGFAPSASITGLNIRGTNNPANDTAALDVVAVTNLNVVPDPSSLTLLVLGGTQLTNRRRKHWLRGDREIKIPVSDTRPFGTPGEHKNTKNCSDPARLESGPIGAHFQSTVPSFEFRK